MKFDQLLCPENIEVKSLSVKFTYKEPPLLTTNDSLTKYLSPIQCSTIYTHITNIIKGGVTDLAIPNFVVGEK